MKKEQTIYKEPKGYFSAGMLKAAQKWEKENSNKQSSKPAPKKGKK